MTNTTKNVIKAIGIVILLLLGMISEAPAQPINPCNPYTGCVTTERDFGNVFLGVEGLEWTNVAVTNKLAAYVVVTIRVVYGTTVIEKEYPFVPNERKDIFLSNTQDWPELAGYKGGVSVTVKAQGQLSVTVTMHPALPANPTKEDLITFWRLSKTLEGR